MAAPKISLKFPLTKTRKEPLTETMQSDNAEAAVNEVTETPETQQAPHKALSLWQIALRINTKVEPNQTEAPPWAPKEAGGEGKKPEPRPWTWEDMAEAETAVRDGRLLPYEVALLQGRTGDQVTGLLCQIKGIKHIPTPAWIPNWARCFPWLKHEPVADVPIWDVYMARELKIYWSLELLTLPDISAMLGRTIKEVLQVAQALQLPADRGTTNKMWCGVGWNFQPDGEHDPKLLDPGTQYLVAQTSAVRFSLLYEKLHRIGDDHPEYKKINGELDKIVRLHTRIFEKFLHVKSRKYNQCSPSPSLTQEDLEQAGKTAIFECLRRWHPDRNIRFSRGAVCIAIQREMIAWLEAQRLVGLPDKIRTLARKLKAAHDSGEEQAEYEKLVKETNERCVAEASKHRNNYAYITTVPLMDTYSDEEAEDGAVCSSSAKCLEGFESVHNPDTNVDLTDLILRASQKLSPPERRAVLFYHGMDETGGHIPQMTLEEIGAKEGVTKERIRQRITKAKERMLRWMEAHKIRQLSDAFAG